MNILTNTYISQTWNAQQIWDGLFLRKKGACGMYNSEQKAWNSKTNNISKKTQRLRHAPQQTQNLIFSKRQNPDVCAREIQRTHIQIEYDIIYITCNPYYKICLIKKHMWGVPKQQKTVLKIIIAQSPTLRFLM